MGKILIVEYDTLLSEEIVVALAGSGVHQAVTVAEAREILKNVDIHVLLLGFANKMGINFLKEVKKNSTINVIILAEDNAEYDEISALERGADDYIVKPFKVDLLRAVVNSELKKVAKKKFRYDFAKKNFYLDNKRLVLTIVEHKMLRLLLEHKGEDVARDVIERTVWGAAQVSNKLLANNIAKLRSKLGEADRIKIVEGGYKWAS
ncbi:response regulator transcription factor [Candidatus Epulonipiscium viviparus]|uniref:response regulator transcription factor n=1 Tax=Candidatus Epulonipiscium viviparus TaxID=420336 RepID=UPI0004976588|nr:response regulator transcription factor [Candidatus Epulopiscium viviparus]